MTQMDKIALRTALDMYNDEGDITALVETIVALALRGNTYAMEVVSKSLRVKRDGETTKRKEASVGVQGKASQDYYLDRGV